MTSQSGIAHVGCIASSARRWCTVANRFDRPTSIGTDRPSICVVLSVCWDARRWLVDDSLTSPTHPCSESSIWCGLSQRSSPTTSCASQHQFTTITRLVRRRFLYSLGWRVLYDAGCGAQPVVGRQHRMPAQPTYRQPIRRYPVGER